MRRSAVVKGFVGAAIGLMLSVPALAGIGEMFGIDPFLDYVTLETPHFRITHAVEHAELADLAARNLEDAHRVLSPVMRWEPTFKIQVVLVDNSDFANGLAGAVGRLGMVLWTTPPDNWMSIAHYDDWFRMLCFHEYAHILNMDVLRGFYAPMRWVFGDSIRPNAVWQSWMLEGLAVSQETSFTRAGRGRSSYYGMLRRGVWRAGMLKPVSEGGRGIGQITGPRTIPPGGEVPYFFGHELMNEMADGRPEMLPQILGDMSWSAADSLPYSYNSYAESASRRDWFSIWDSWSEKASERAERETALVVAAGVTELEWLSQGNVQSYRPAISPDGRWAAYGRERYDEQPVLAIRDLSVADPQKAERRLIENIGGGSVAFTEDGSAVVFSTVEREGLFRFFSQLWAHELSSGKSYALELPDGVRRGLRAKDPDIRGDRIVFSVASLGKISIALGRLARGEDGKLRLAGMDRVYEPDLLGRASTPRLSPDGKRIVFSVHRNGELEERLILLENSGGGWKGLEVATGATPGSFDRFPAWIDDQTLVFSSNRSGIDNLYRMKLGATAVSAPSVEAITNVESAAWFAAPLADGRMLATVYTPTGWELARLTPKVSKLPVIDTEPSIRVQSSELVTPEATPEEVALWKRSDYSVYPSLLPRGWAPLLVSSPSGGTLAQALLSGFDALDIHRYSLLLGYETELGTPSGVVQYSNRRLGAVWSLTAASQIRGIGVSSYEREDSFSAAVSLFRPFTEAVLNPGVEWAWERESVVSRSAGTTLESTVLVPRLRAAVSFSDTDTSRQSVLTEEGWTALLGHQWSLGRDRTEHELIWNQGHFFHLGGHHVIWPRWQLAFSDSDTVQVEGRRNQLVDSFAGSNFDQLVLRGYPLQVFDGLQAAGVGSLDFRMPLWRLEQGWSTYPLFFEVLQGVAFAETAGLATPGVGLRRLSSWGVGVRGDWVVMNVLPLVTALEYHQGLNRDLGGKSELFFEFRLGGLAF